MTQREHVRSGLWAALVALVGWATPGVAEERPGAQSETRYPVKVEVREVKNRLVEGRVRTHKLYVDQPRAFGADDSAPTPPETLAFALGSCVVSTARLVALQKKLELKAVEAVVEGTLDFARALDLARDRRAGFPALKISVKLEGRLTAAEKRALLEEARQRCPMCDNLANPTSLTYELVAGPAVPGARPAGN